MLFPMMVSNLRCSRRAMLTWASCFRVSVGSAGSALIWLHAINSASSRSSAREVSDGFSELLPSSSHLLLEELMEFTRSCCAPCTAPSLPQGSHTSPSAGNNHPLESVYVQSLKTEAGGHFRIPFIPGSVSDAFNGKFRAWILTLERVDGAVAGIYAFTDSALTSGRGSCTMLLGLAILRLRAGMCGRQSRAILKAGRNDIVIESHDSDNHLFASSPSRAVGGKG